MVNMSNNHETPKGGMSFNLSPFQKKALIAAGVLSAIAVGAYAARKYFLKSTASETAEDATSAETNADIEISPKKNKKKKKKTKKKANKQDALSDEILYRKLIESLNVLQNTANTRGSAEQQILKYIRSISASDYSVDTRFAAANWIVIYLTVALLTATTQEQVTEVLRNQNNDMHNAWELLNFNDSSLPNIKDQERAKMLRLDVAQRLKDIEKLLPLFEEILEVCETTVSNENLVVCFTIAPLLGRWADFVKIGKKLIANGQNLAEFHQASTQRADLPDYEMLYRMALAEMEEYPALPIEEVAWRAFDMRQCEIKFRSVETEDEAHKGEVEKNFAQQPGWQSLEVGEHSKIIRSGAMLQTIGISSVPLAMVGPARSDRVLLSGYADLEHPQLGGKVKQSECYDLAPDAEDSAYWVGTYTVNQEKDGTPPLSMAFDMRLKLEEVPFPV